MALGNLPPEGQEAEPLARGAGTGRLDVVEVEHGGPGRG